MSLFSKLFGGGGDAGKDPSPEVYKEFRVYAEPAREGGSYRVAARIEKEIDGETRTHHLIRADTFESADGAAEASVSKAKMLIDEQGERIF